MAEANKPTLSKHQSQLLARLGLQQPWAVALHLPSRYLDRTVVVPLHQLQPGQEQLVEGVIGASDITGGARKQWLVRLDQGQHSLFLRFLHFQSWQVGKTRIGAQFRAFGLVRMGFYGLEMVHPQLESAATPVQAALEAIYPTVEGLSQAQLRRHVATVLKQLDLSEPLAAFLPPTMWPWDRALRHLHQPASGTDVAGLSTRQHPAWLRIKFDELLAQQLALKSHRAEQLQLSAPALTVPSQLEAQLLAAIGWDLTAAQRRVAAEISADLSATVPMQRLLQGDVGSGKTVVAALACLRAVASGHQAVVLAPTEILAEQHFVTLSRWFGALSISPSLLLSATPSKLKKKLLSDLASGAVSLLIATHAALEKGVQFSSLALAVVDEQHRFGVEQRLKLLAKGGTEPASADQSPSPSGGASATAKGQGVHQLMMSATPIPRTLAMSYLADLSISTLDEMPPGRLGTRTRLVDIKRRDELIAALNSSLSGGERAYWICPLVEESDELPLSAALATYEEFVQRLAPIQVALIHGRMSAADKQQAMLGFKNGHSQLLVATTVVEVGVDVPEANLIVIEHAERMGLAQLHQLRGRVGRGQQEGLCVLLYDGAKLSDNARERLKAMRETTDGFDIARRDLRLRGPGEFLGLRQSGHEPLRYADTELDHELLDRARSLADELLAQDETAVSATLNHWPSLAGEHLRV